MPYRGDSDPLKAKESALSRELDSLRRREGDVSRELDATQRELRNRRTPSLPMLDAVRIASPCSASWDEMIGDARVRFCGKCAKNVYNLSEMTRDEAEGLLARAEGSVCVRLYKRNDGTVMTSDCPVGVKRKRFRRVAAAAAATMAGVAGLGALQTTTVMGACARPQIAPHEVLMGDVGPAETATPTQVRPPAPHAPPAPTVVLQGRTSLPPKLGK
jgi:hypothetical protein